MAVNNIGDNQPSRFEKSLGLLTTRFVTLLQKAKDGILDLKVVSRPYVIALKSSLPSRVNCFSCYFFL